MEKIYNKLDKIENKIDVIVKDITEMKVELGQQRVGLDHHIKRSDLLEMYLDKFRSKVNYVEGALKLVGFLSLITGITVALIKIFHS